jgi:hypothetical protein
MAPFIVEQSRTQRFGNDFERRECALSDTTKVQERNDEAGDDKTMVWSYIATKRMSVDGTMRTQMQMCTVR